MLKLNHKKMDVWLKSKSLVKEIYKVCNSLPKEEQFTMIPQLKRAAISVSSNIAEGFARHSKRETTRFLDISRSSLVEIDTQIELCLELSFLKENELVELSEIVNHEFAMLSNLIKKVNS